MSSNCSGCDLTRRKCFLIDVAERIYIYFGGFNFLKNLGYTCYRFGVFGFGFWGKCGTSYGDFEKSLENLFDPIMMKVNGFFFQCVNYP